ncbi:MAG: hypothetical protein ABSA15_02690 [Thermoplasmata archaeon]|jgi:ZIP family zinc transporter
MSDFLTFFAVTAIMGLSIFISLPLILYRGTPASLVVLLNALAIGILIFLIADIFSDVASINIGSATYLTNPGLDLLFVVGVTFSFVILYFIDNRAPALATAEGLEPPATDLNPRRVALIIAIGMGFQNLTEGLVFGVYWVAGDLTLLGVIFVGFFLQNITEGFPIGAPFMGQRDRPTGRIIVYFLIGGLPTILGGTVGYVLGTNPGAYYDQILVFFDAVAIGALVYVILPMIRVAFRREGTAMAHYAKQRLVYFGVLAGFLLGFVVNAF